MDKSERIFHLHKMIKTGKAPTRAQLMEATQASKSSFDRAIDHMRTFFGAPIIYCPKRRGYLYDPAEPAFEMPGLWMSPSELHALLACEQMLESVQPGLLTPELGPFKSRLRRMLNNSGYNHKTVAHKIRMPTANARHPEANRFSIVAEATLREQQLLINYSPRTRDSEKQDSKDRRIEPQRLLRYRDNWLLIGWCHQRQALRTFAIDRIRQPRIAESNQHPIDDKALDRFSNASFGIFSGTATDWAVLQFESEPAKWVRDECWHPEQIGQDLPGGRYELQVPYSDTRELLMEVLKYGAGVEVIAPDSLRERVLQILTDSIDKYR